MLASLSSFLPDTKYRFSNIIGGQQPPATPNVAEIDDDDDGKSIATQPDDTALLKKSKDKRQSPNETFIFVRPPPAKSNHPLNLQVQLVPPNSRAPTGITNATGSVNSRRSFDISALPSSSPPGTADTTITFASQQDVLTDEPLARTMSNRSTVSAYSANTSTASFSTVGSTASARRMIIPLYNLQAHNVMTNVIVDAGTDAKIAKFSKRGMEMISLAVLEPVEVWGSAQGGGNFAVLEGRRSVDNSRFLSPTLPVQPLTPGSSHLSLSSAGAEHQSPEPAPSTPIPAQGGKRNIFGKIFKRKEVSSSGPPPPVPVPNSPYGHARTPSLPTSTATSNPSKRLSQLTPGSPVAASTSATSLATPPPQIAAQTLGVAPQLSLAPPFALGASRTGRPTMYVWVVRKWLKGEQSVAAALLSPKRPGSFFPDVQSVEVRFEWRRGKGGKKKRPANTTATSHSSGESKDKGKEGETEKERKRRHRLSGQSASTNLTSEDHNSLRSSPSPKSRQPALPDDGNESDPEDSETPWTCALKLRTPKRSAGVSQQGDEGGAGVGTGGDGPMKVKLGTLSPTPHHPKVVAMLKVPFPLPDVDVATRAVRTRTQARSRTRGGVSESGQVQFDFEARNGNGLDEDEGDGEGEGEGGLTLTAEEIKDVICATGLWLVVREGFGGVGKEKRKGDGWRIRA